MVMETQAVFTREFSWRSTNMLRPRRQMPLLDCTSRRRKPEIEKKNSAVPTLTSSVATPNHGPSERMPWSSRVLYATPMSAMETTKSATESGRLRSLTFSLTLSARRRSIRRKRDTVPTLNTRETANMRTKHSTVWAAAAGENTSEKPVTVVSKRRAVT